MKKIGLTMFLFLFTNLVFASKIATFPDLLKPGRFVVDGKQIFITEGITIRIYSLEDFSLQKKFGKMGEGPREFLKKLMVPFAVKDPVGFYPYYINNGKLYHFNSMVDNPWHLQD
jgi:hypothetical protein